MAKKSDPTAYNNPIAEEFVKNQERLKKSVYKTPTPHIPGQSYTWVFGFTLLDRPVLWGPYASDAEAEVNAVELDRYELYHLKTIDTAKASRIVKHDLIEQGKSPDEAMSRLQHKHKAREKLQVGRKRRWWR